MSEEQPKFAFLLQPEFPLNAFILATEALRIANQNSGKDLFDWVLASETGKPVRASNGMRMVMKRPMAIRKLPSTPSPSLNPQSLVTARSPARG